jgi:hypothetical protein
MMPELDLSWLDALPDMRISGVQRVQGVQRQKTVLFACTPQGVQRCASTPAEVPAHRMHTPAHLVHTSSPPQKMAENRDSTPCTPCTPDFDDGREAAALIDRGLTILRRRPVPLGCSITQWTIIIGDALRLREDGWVTKALGLGWSVSDLFGAHGLATWLDCRRVTLLDADGANAGPWCRGFMGPAAGRYRRVARADASLIWEIGH